MNHLLRPRIWASFLVSSGVGSCDVPVQVRLGTNTAVPRDGCQARGASACAARGTPIFMVSRQQFKKYPGLRTDNNGKC